MDWFIERLNCINPTLDYQDIFNYADDFKKLKDLKIIKHQQTLESLPCDWCEEDHFLSPFVNNKKEIIISCYGNRRVVDPEELKIWTINKDTLIENIKLKKPIIDKKLFEQTAFASKIDDEKCWIVNKGDKYYFNGSLIDIKGNPDYFKTFDIVFSLMPEGGKKLYEKIIKIGKTHFSKINRGSIQRALTTKASYLYKNTGINFYVLGSTQLFEADPKGKFLQFNNKK